MSCVNTNSRKFKDLLDKTNVSSATLELIIHKVQNSENSDRVPSIKEINDLLRPKPFKGNEDAVEIWNKYYYSPIKFPTLKLAIEERDKAIKLFGNDSVSIIEKNDNTYDVVVGRPSNYRDQVPFEIKDLKPEYQGKLIFAQSGTGKSILADNKTVIDSDFLLGKVLGVSTETAGFFFNSLSKEQKKVFGKIYRDLIKEEVAKGNTVVTANISMISDADVVVYNSNTQQTEQRTNSSLRASTNRYHNSQFHENTFKIINNLKTNDKSKKYIELNDGEYLSDVLGNGVKTISIPEYNKYRESRQGELTKEKFITDFLDEFGMSVNYMEGYDGKLPLFDALNRVINAKKADDIVEGVGYAIAFMMQTSPEMQKIITLSHGVKGDYNTKLPIINRTVKNLHPIQNSPVAREALREVGRQITTELRNYFNEKSTKNNSIWEIIKNFFTKLGMSIIAMGHRKEVKEQQKFLVSDIIEALGREDFSRIKGPLIKEGTTEKAIQVNVERALKEHPFEESIISKLSDNGIALAGSASIALEGTLYRPNENPLHDIDFQAYKGATKESLDTLMPKIFGNNKVAFASEIKGKNGNNTVTYITLNVPFVVKNRTKTGWNADYYSPNGKLLGKKRGSDLILEEGVEGKLLDFFTGPQTNNQPTYTREINGKEYLLSRASNAMAAKILWSRPKDIWDYKNYRPFKSTERETEDYFETTSDNRIDYYQGGSTLGISYNGESKALLQNKIDSRIKSLEKERANLNNVLSLMDIAKEDFKNLPLERKVGALRRKAASFNKEYNTSIRVDNEGNVVHNMEELDNNISKLKDSTLADNIIKQWHTEQASLRQEEINKDLELLNREDYISEDSVENAIENERAIAILESEGITLDNSLIDKFLDKINHNNPYHLLFKQVVEILRNNNIPINIVIDSNLKGIAARRQDGFKTATVRFNPSLLLEYLMTDDKANIKGNIMKIVTHELIHAVTAEILESHPSWAKIKGFNEAQTEFVNKTWDLYLQCKEQLKGTKWYGLKNAKEFVAVALTDRDFQIALSEIKVKEKSAFKRFINYLTNLFNKIFEAQGINIKDSALEEIISISQEYFNYANKDLRGGIYDYSKSANDYFKNEGTFEEYSKFQAPINETTEEKILNGKLGFTRNGEIIVSRNLSKEDVFKYIKGEIKSATSEQKRVVFEELANEGYTESKLRDIIQTDEDAKKLITYHELSHKYWEDNSNEYYQGDPRTKDGTLIKSQVNWLSPNKIEVEKRATLDAIHRIELEKESTKTTEEVQINQEDKKQDLYTTKQQDKMQQIDNLLGDNLLSATEVRHIAEQAVYWISDHITELQENPELAKTIYGDRFKNEDGTDKDFASMTRADVVRTIGVDNIVEMCKQKFSPEHNDFEDFDTIDKATAITDNWQAIMLLAQDSFLNLEDFSIVSTPDGKANEVNEDIVGDADNFNESNSQSDVEEVEGNLQEHWQIESRCQDVLGTMSQMVRRALLKCYILDKDGNNVQSEFGINERINVREATNSILRWTQGSLSLADMVAKLQEKQEDNPWVKQLINRLSDTSGKETDFQGQFYGTFSKHFQPYSVVIEEDGKYKSIQVNENPALSEAMTQVTTQYKIGEHPLFTTDGINKESFKELRAAYDSLEKFKHMGYDLSKEVNKDEAANTLGYISNLLGYYVTPDMVKSNLTNENYRKMYSALGYMIKSFENNLDNSSYEPFKFKAKDSINGNMREFLKPITEYLEDIAVSAFYDSGKMYQSYVTPSYMSKLMQKFSQKGEAFDKFLTEEFGNQPWFHEGTDIERGWRNSWLRALVTDSKTREIFKHKVQLNFNKHNYMRDMDDMEYTLSLFTEYFSEGANDKQSRVPAWFRVPMLSNKPSSEFIRFYSERGTNYRETITEGMMDIFNQELSRIQTVLMRNLDSKDPRFIKNFDKNGRKFCFLDFMNDYLTGDKKNSELGKLINDKVNGKEVDEAKLYELANKAIFNAMDAKAKAIVEAWINSGLIEGAKKITGIGTTEEEIKSNLENFVWNDTFAAMNIMELTVTDIAYYKNAEDLQKRLAQIHAPGIRGNVEATDYDGRKVSDGKERTFYLTDWDDFISNIIDNVSIVFDRKIANAPEAEKNGYRALKESLVGKDGAFRKINVADAQGYSSPTSYRKKAFIFGKWSKKAEEIYQKLRKGDYNYSDLSVAFQPLKPFVYSQIEKPSGVPNAPLDKLKVPVQNKNSEYLLIMADAILQSENTGRPNLLRAIYEVMEESHYDENGNYKTDGIDTVQFESTVKSGLMGRINLNKYINDANGEAKAKAVMEACLYETAPKTVQEVNPETGELEDVTINTKTGKYSQTYVQELPFEDYCLQQEVPEHFKNHEQVHGSQLRYIVVSELATKDSFGNDATYEVEGKKLSAEEFKAEYEQTVADNIEDSINELSDILGFNSINAKDRNIALSKILQREILSSPRYGVDLLQACSVDENGRFRIPLGDPIQSKRVEQLINSIIKNRVNKQEIAGGPVVQVTNFGTSRELNIRFKDKNGGLLKIRAEYEKNPIKKELSQTDKFNAKYKGLKTSESTMSYEDYIKENQGGIAYFEVFAPIYANNLFSQFADKNGNISIEALEALDPDLLKMIGYRIPTEAKYSMAPLKIVGFLPREAGDGIMLPNDITLLTGSDFDVDKEYLMRKDYNISRNKISKSALHKILYDALVETQSKKLSYEAKSNLNDLVRQFLEDPFDRASLVNQKTADGFISIPSSSYSKLLKLYLQNAFTVEKPTEGRIYRNNKIVDMTYEVLTHETSCAEMLNPGGFDQQKRMGYLVTALRTTDKSYEELSKMSIDELKDLSDKDKNLMFVDTHVQFYKQNSAAGSLIGIFAVNRTAHAVIENEGYMMNVDNACRLTRPFTVAGMTFGGNMPIDVRFDNNGQSVGKVLGSLVASAADAVKDPVLNLMNINSNTANILNTLIRLGMPFDDAALFLSQRAISSALNQFSSENITGFTSLSKVVDDRIAKMESRFSIDENSVINKEELTREELIEGIKVSDPRIEYKVLKAFRNFQRLADAMRMPTFATRFNSISSAVGPLIIDNLITEHKMEKLSSESNILGSDGEEISINDIFLAHPILNQFRRTFGIAQGLFGNMPANSTGFRNILAYISENPIGDVILNDRKILSSLSDFYQSYLVVAGNVVNSSDLGKVISEFPKEFMEKNYKKQYNDNLLIQSIKYGTDKGGRATLQIDITGLDTQQKERLSSAWIDLHKVNPELSEQLFKYCFFRAGIGFSPKTFMSLVPIYVKERLNSYVDTFRVLPSSTPEIVLDQFIRNNWDNNRLVPRKKNIVMRRLGNGNFEVYKESDVKELQKTQYFKMKVGNVDKLYQQVLLKDGSIEYKEVSPLGSNKDYLEVSVDGIDKPIEIPSTSLEDNEKSEISSSTDGEAKSDETTLSKQEQIDLLHQIYMTKGKTFADAEKTIQNYKAMDNEFKKAIESQVKNFMKSRLETLGIKFDEKTIEEEYKKLC